MLWTSTRTDDRTPVEYPEVFDCTMVTADGEGFRMNLDHSHELRKQARSRELVAAYQMICKHKTFCNGAIWCHHGLKIGWIAMANVIFSIDRVQHCAEGGPSDSPNGWRLGGIAAAPAGGAFSILSRECFLEVSEFWLMDPATTLFFSRLLRAFPLL